MEEIKVLLSIDEKVSLEIILSEYAKMQGMLVAFANTQEEEKSAKKRVEIANQLKEKINKCWEI